MFAVITYDVNEKRIARIEKILGKYLVHTQNSVFEGNIDRSTLAELERELSNAISPDEDSIRIYLFESRAAVKTVSLGQQRSPSNVI